MPALDFTETNTFIALGGACRGHTVQKTGRDAEREENEWPISWTVPHQAIIGDDEPITIPTYVEKVVPDAEPAVVVGDSLWQASPMEAAEAIKGMTVSNDVTIHGRFPGYPYPEQDGRALGRGYKTLPTFSPTCFDYVSDVPDTGSDELSIITEIDGVTVSRGSLTDFKWSIPELVSHSSKIYRLQENDIISLGGPPMMTEKFLDDAEQVTCIIDGIGELTNPIRRI